MKKNILLLILIATINLTANPFSQMKPSSVVANSQVSQKFFYAKRAAERGNARAQYDLGLMYATGNGVAKNEALALMWFNRAAQNNFVKTAPKTAPKIKGASKKFFYAKEAAAKGNARAQFDLAMMYLNGNGVAQNERLAFHYFHKAARNNLVEAKFQMGLSFSKGRGVRKQAQLARYWFKLAVKAGHPKAMAHLASIEQFLKPQFAQNRRVAMLSRVSTVREF